MMIRLLLVGFGFKIGLAMILLIGLLVFGRRRVSDLVIDVLELHRFFIAIARAAVNDDGCAVVALHPTVWSSGGLAKKRRVCVSA